MRISLVLSSGVALCSLALQGAPGAAQGHPHPTWVWALPQFVPSPAVTVGRGEASLGLRWQLTPLLLALGLRRGVNPWRSFVVEPLVRHAGSLELHVGPEWLSLDRNGHAWAWRSGLRAYLPVLERGENLAVSLGVSHLLTGSSHSAWVEVGAYVLFGVLGLQLGWSPTADSNGVWMGTFRVRYF
ncbi:MAG: hypothetical protein HY909_02560 [Deltaproteobacteria bacterium]|nr:hypothetical protein [Deltaproteobacteria bacterium]